VTKEEYNKYYKEYEHARYCRLNASRKVVHNLELDTFEPDYITAINPFTRLAEPSVEDIVVEHLMDAFKVKRLHEAMDTLTPGELDLINKLFFMNKRQKDVAAELGITQQGVSKRLSAILRKLRSLLGNLAE
jgi:RNA polymerase sigma factor (sigma-70 family)